MADLLFCQFGFSSFVMLKLSTDLLKWLNPNYKTGGYLTVILPIANKESFSIVAFIWQCLLAW